MKSASYVTASGGDDSLLAGVPNFLLGFALALLGTLVRADEKNANSLVKEVVVKKTGFACVCAVLLAAPAFAVGYSTGHGGGGDLQGAESIAAQYNNSGEQFRIRGRCLSSCTVFLSIRNVCIEPSARFGFHAGPTPISTSRMETSYNQKLRSHLASVGAMQSRNYYFLSARDMTTKFGYKVCPRS